MSKINNHKFVGVMGAYDEARDKIVEIEKEFKDYLLEIRK